MQERSEENQRLQSNQKERWKAHNETSKDTVYARVPGQYGDHLRGKKKVWELRYMRSNIERQPTLLRNQGRCLAFRDRTRGRVGNDGPGGVMMLYDNGSRTGARYVCIDHINWRTPHSSYRQHHCRHEAAEDWNIRAACLLHGFSKRTPI